ncbi:MAG TPA: PDDEXK nuclease domain-containing protein [Chitinophaga sp.]|uniref:PDDEXK nuclease domain-containing protein n=1 Tax=Chitinophaga sp. TaxID=1869181 RepID=UPI002F92C4D6
MNFNFLLHRIENTHQHLQESAAKAVNRLLTIRNWLIGYYIVEYEQNGEDRAKYGEKLLENIAKSLPGLKISVTNLKLFRQFYKYYPQIRQTVADELRLTKDPIFKIGQSLTGELLHTENQPITIPQSVVEELGKYPLHLPADKLLSKLSFTHITLLLTISDPLQRAFYELETIKGNWSVRELKRQINSLYFERMGLSKNKEKLQQFIHEADIPIDPADFIKNMYTFEFLDLPQKALVIESDLEAALLGNLQDFLLEMGPGFCLEARQKRILIGDEHFFIDLVFYHRILKCHVLVELKVDAFNHVNAGQLNTYLNYYKAEVMEKDDNPPIGILMVTNKNETLVQYATAGMDQSLFVKQYQVKLPSKEALEQFIRQELRYAPAV